MRGLFWNKLPDVSIGTSIWKDLSDQNVSTFVMQAYTEVVISVARYVQALLEREEIEKLFRAAAPAAMPAAPDPSKAAASGPIMLFDAKRQQNAGIPLARVRLTPKEVRDAVLAMDANGERRKLYSQVMAFDMLLGVCSLNTRETHLVAANRTH
jgi:hypothetical protein